MFWRIGHYRTSINGVKYWVKGHNVDRNGWDRHSLVRFSNNNQFSHENYNSRLSTGIDLNSHTWSKGGENFCKPTTCPICDQYLYFIRHNGGSVWLDSLGNPWPKHACFDDNVHLTCLRRKLIDNKSEIFGVVMKVQAIVPSFQGLIVVQCNNETTINELFYYPENITDLLGRLVIVKKTNENVTILSLFGKRADKTNLPENNGSQCCNKDILKQLISASSDSNPYIKPVIVQSTSKTQLELQIKRFIGVLKNIHVHRINCILNPLR